MLRSIRGKLTWIILLQALGLAVAFLITLFLSIRINQYATVESFLTAHLQAAQAYHAQQAAQGDAASQASNTVLAISDPRIRLQIYGQTGALLADNAGVPASGAGPAEVLAVLQNPGPPQRLEQRLRNEHRLSLIAPLRQGNTVVGAVRVATRIDSVDAEIRRQMLAYAGLAMAITLPILLIGLLLARSVAEPIRQITELTRAIGRGDYTARADVRNQDETRELAQSLAVMATDLQRNETLRKEFISQISHELRTPLTNILGWTATIRDTPAAEPDLIDKGISIIEREAGRLAELVDELLDFSRLQSGSLHLQLKRTDLAELCRQSADVMQPRARRGGVELKVLAEVPIWADVDPARIHQILLNLLDNAIKHTESDHQIQLSCQRSSTLAKIIVQDQGSGIPPDVLPHVREMFYAHGDSRGSGIGLALADQLAQLHGGELLIDSDVGEGTTVTLQLPLPEDQQR